MQSIHKIKKLNPFILKQYLYILKQHLETIQNPDWLSTRKAVPDTAEENIGHIQTTDKPNKIFNKEVESFTILEKDLRLKISTRNNLEKAKQLIVR